jgi:SAM-dependent methyltransferase
MQAFLRRYVPSAATLRLRRAALALRERWAAPSADGDPLLPPRHLLDFVGGGDFLAQGALHRDFFIRYGGLRPTDRVLDVGCGIGRMALPLTTYLEPEATYDGFDIVPEAIAWCQGAITPRFPNFRFHHADIANTTYNPRGRLRAEDYRFPFADGAFDLQLSTSVFTHLRRAALAHYLAEIARTLAPGGRSLNTIFLLDSFAADSVAAGRASQDFRYLLPEGGRAVSRVDPEKAIAFELDDFVAMLAAVDLVLVEPILWGGWSARQGAVAYQDMVVAERAITAPSPRT